MKQLARYFWQTIAHPRTAFDALASKRSIRWALAAAALPVLQVWGNVALHALFGLDWLGTRPYLTDPTFVGGYGHWHVQLAGWVPIFVALMPLLALLNLLLHAGLAQLLSKLWGGQGTFEQMVNTLTFATVAPNMVVAGISEWLFGVPVVLITRHPYWWNAAMLGEFGPVVGAVWNVYVLGVYIGVQWAWTIALGSTAIRRVQRIPKWAAVLTMLLAFAVTTFLATVFVR